MLYKNNPFDLDVRKAILEKGDEDDLLIMYQSNPFDIDVRRAILERGRQKALLHLYQNNPFDSEVRKVILERGGKEALLVLYRTNPFDPETKKAMLDSKDEDLLALLYKSNPFDTETKKAILQASNKLSETKGKKKKADNYEYDFFICHASEDKESFVNQLASALKSKGLRVWYDNFVLVWGDSLRAKISEGLKKSRYGIVVFSSSFLKIKKWTEYELNSLFAKEEIDKKVILPILHNIGREDMLEYDPDFADRLSYNSKEIDKILKECVRLSDIKSSS